MLRGEKGYAYFGWLAQKCMRVCSPTCAHPLPSRRLSLLFFPSPWTRVRGLFLCSAQNPPLKLASQSRNRSPGVETAAPNTIIPTPHLARKSPRAALNPQVALYTTDNQTPSRLLPKWPSQLGTLTFLSFREFLGKSRPVLLRRCPLLR